MDYDKLQHQCGNFFKLAASKEYQRKYMADRYRRLRQEAIDYLGGKCVNCGAVSNLEFDHIDQSTKAVPLGRINSISKKKIYEELDKCQLLCNTCHKNKTRDSWDYSTPQSRHGTEWMYRKYKCRCDECVNAHKESIQYWSERRRERKNQLEEVAA